MLCLSPGCNDAPDPVGIGTQPAGDFGIIRVDTFYATGHSSLPNLLYTSSIDRFMLGKYKTYQAWACLKFASWPDSMIGVTITSATIRLKSVYHFGDSMSVLSFDAYRARASWASDSLTYDSLNQNTINQPLYNYYYDVSTKHSSTIQPGDTDWVTIDIPDMTMLREWFSTNSDTTHLNDGIILSPTNSNVIRGFYSYYASDTSYQPTLYVNYVGAYGPNTYVHKVSSSKYVSVIDRANLITDDNLIYVQDGISYRGLISFDSILTTWPVSIHRAVLQVTLDESNSSPQFNFFPTPFLNDSLYALSVGTNSKPDGSFYALSQRSTSNLGHVIYSFESAGLAARWLNNSSARKVALGGFFESGSFDLFTIYSETASEIKLRPRIIISYSIKR